VSLLSISGLVKTFSAPDGTSRRVLDVPQFELGCGEHAALAGGSGSGKTTLLHIIAGVLRADSGSVSVDDTELTALSESARDAWRARCLGYVFQTFNLLQGYTALENVLLGMAFGNGMDRGRAQELLERLGLADRMHHRPRQLSIGQQQRVAVARALANAPVLVLADEPTGNLDAANAGDALRLLRESCDEEGAALLVVSHDPRVLAAFERVVSLDSINRAAARTELHHA
jgi:putative ABC transport system ATP-binding protein